MKVLTFGEIMLRLRAPWHERLFQSGSLEATFGGGEANVAVSLANYGVDVEYFTILPDNSIADACVRELRKFGVDTRKIQRGEGRMGLYFLEAGSNQIPSRVVYDRAYSAISLADPASVDWKTVLAGRDWFHISGITPAISRTAMELSLAAVHTAKEMGLTVSCDFNYRNSLWKYEGADVKKTMSQLLTCVDVLSIGEDDVRTRLGIPVELSETDTKVQRFEKLDAALMAAYPNLKLVVNTMRESMSAERNGWSACLYDGKTMHVSRRYEILDIVDRVGGGDSFFGGLVYGLSHYEKDLDAALEFATAASCLKLGIPGDFNRVSAAEVEQLMKGVGAQIQR